MSLLRQQRPNIATEIMTQYDKANGSRECAPDDRLRVPTICHGARAFAHLRLQLLAAAA
jgi:hypothetical protein